MKITDHDATGQADLVRHGEATPKELATAAIDAIDRLDGELDAVLHRSFDRALKVAEEPADLDAPFCGVPMLLKDFGPQVEGFPYSFGALPFLRSATISGNGWAGNGQTEKLGTDSLLADPYGWLEDVNTAEPVTVSIR